MKYLIIVALLCFSSLLSSQIRTNREYQEMKSRNMNYSSPDAADFLLDQAYQPNGKKIRHFNTTRPNLPIPPPKLEINYYVPENNIKIRSSQGNNQILLPPQQIIVNSVRTIHDNVTNTTTIITKPF